jgi:hypothetical protein
LGRPGGGPGNDYGAAVALNPGGNPVITGEFVGTGRFGNQTFVGYGDEEIFVSGREQKETDTNSKGDR